MSIPSNKEMELFINAFNIAYDWSREGKSYNSLIIINIAACEDGYHLGFVMGGFRKEIHNPYMKTAQFYEDLEKAIQFWLSVYKIE